MRLIDADALIEDVKQLVDFLYSFEVNELVECGRIIHNGIIQEVTKMPTIDAEPVRHGKWISHGSYTTCSVCGEEQYGIDTGRYYCQNCGAKMDSNDSNDSNALNALEMDEVNE